MKKQLLTITLFMLYFIANSQNIRYVDINATGNSDGTSWANADTSLMNTLSSLDTSGIEVWVAEGTYLPGTSSSSTFAWIRDNIEVYGGFDGTETARSQRDWIVNETILSGDIGILGDETDNCLNVVQGPFVLPFAPPGFPTELYYGLLDGFAIENGYNSSGAGAGVFMNDNVHKLVIQNCHIRNNMARYEAAIFAKAESNDKELVINSCIVSGNEGRWGIGTSVQANSAKMKLTITNSLYYGNTIVNLPNFGSGSNGIITLNANGTNPKLDVEIINTTFTANHNGGWHSQNNKSTIQYYSSTASGSKDIRIDNCIFWGNSGDSLSIIKSLNSTGPFNVSVRNTLSEFEVYSSSAVVSNIIYENPLFNNPLNYVFSLQDSSKALNAGSILGLTIPIEDLAGNTRIVNGTIDLGCYEHQTIIPILNPNGINDLAFENVSVFPNPTNGILNLDISEELSSIRVMDLTGKTIKIFNENSTQLDISDCTPGIYFIEIANDQKKSVLKMIKR